MVQVKPTIVFLRGLTRGNIHWGDFIQLLQSKTDFNCVCLEIPGNGLKSDLTTPIDPTVLVDELRSELKLKIDCIHYHLCGISLGGMVAMKWAEIYSEEVISTVVINSSLKQLSPFYERLIPKNYLKLFSLFFLRDTYKIESSILDLTSNNESRKTKFIDNYSDFLKTHPFRIKNLFLQFVLANNIFVNFSKINHLFVIYSEQDHLVNQKCSIAIAKINNAKFKSHPSAGHDLPLDEPDWLCNIIILILS